MKRVNYWQPTDCTDFQKCTETFMIFLLLLRQVNISRVVMPDLIRHPVFSMDVACASEDTGACALQGTRAPWGIRRNDGNLVVLLPE
jgi:hypothetical protein